MASKPRVVVVGAGFGGLQVARKLAGKPVDVLLIDRDNYHLFTPLLYQVASSLLNPSDIAQPVRSIFHRGANVRFRKAEVTSVDFAGKTVSTADGAALAYDYLVLAPGSTTNYFGIESAAERAQGLKDLPEALGLRNHVLASLETATRTSPDEAEPWLKFVVAGGGPTGVEYALSRKGCELSRALKAIGAWAHRWLPEDGTAPARARTTAKRGTTSE